MWWSAVGVLVTFTLVILTAPLADAQAPTKVHRIGQLITGSPLPWTLSIMEAFRQGLRDLGYVEGQNLIIEERWGEGQEERLRDLAAELVRLQVEVIVARGAAAIRAAQHATSTIPIVMATTYDAVGQGFVASLARPGANITGLSYLGAELPGKQLDLLKQMVPQASRVAVLANPAAPGHGPRLENLTVAGRALGVQLQVMELRSAAALDNAFMAMAREGADALFVLAEPQLIDRLQGPIVEFAAKRRLPAMYGWRRDVEAGGLISYGPSLPDLSRRAATYVDKILKGAKPADLPVEQPMKFELVINLNTAQALGITIPPHLLVLADEVIK